jgi:hypothetical protein
MFATKQWRTHREPAKREVELAPLPIKWLPANYLESNVPLHAVLEYFQGCHYGEHRAFRRSIFPA